MTAEEDKIIADAVAAANRDDDDDDDDDDDLEDDVGGLPGDPKTKKRKERLEQNRVSARESRKRKKTMIEELQRTVITLSRENKDLNGRNEQLRRNLMEIGTKVSVYSVSGIKQKCKQSLRLRRPLFCQIYLHLPIYLLLAHTFVVYTTCLTITRYSIPMWFPFKPL
jgi:hypothetical protein